jgi:hypothetical protein
MISECFQGARHCDRERSEVRWAVLKTDSERPKELSVLSGACHLKEKREQLANDTVKSSSY